MKRLLLLGMVVAATPGCVFAWEGLTGYEYSAPRAASIAIGDATRVRVVARAGSLRVEGRSGLTEVRATGTAYAAREDELDDIELTATRSGRTVLIEAHIPNRPRGQRKLDIVIELPASMALDIEDSSGSIEIRDVAGVDVTDGSGSITIEAVAGDVTLNDGSGSIEVREVEGRVLIEDDGSGSITVANVEGDLIVEEDGSGSIRATDVGGDFVVQRDGSGGIRYEGISGRVSVPD